MPTAAQIAKRRLIPSRYRHLYDQAVGGSRRATLRYHCLECVAWVSREVERCTAPGCVCYPYRLTGTHERASAVARARASAAGFGVSPGVALHRGENGESSPDEAEDGAE